MGKRLREMTRRNVNVMNREPREEGKRLKVVEAELKGRIRECKAALKEVNEDECANRVG